MTWQPIRLDGLLAKIETTYGTDAVPVVGTNAVRISERIWSSFRILENWPNTNEEASAGTIFGTTPGGPRGRYVEFTAAWQTRGHGSDNPVEADPLFRAAGWAQAHPANVVNYTLAALAHESATCYLYGGGLLVKVGGCRGSLRWDFTPGRLGIIRFFMRGRLLAIPTDVALPGGFAFDATAPLATVGLTFTVGAWSPAIIACEFNQGADA